MLWVYKYFLNSYNNNNKRNRKARVSVERIFQDFSKWIIENCYFLAPVLELILLQN